MPCYHPQLLLYNGFNDDGKPQYKFVGTQGLHESKYERRHPLDKLIPCRQCIGCRLDYSRRWADRLMLELDHSKTALFLTLTYDNDHVTPAMYDDNLGQFWYTLVKDDLQRFNKRLRKYFTGKEIRFFAAGEYGDQTLRPHYHGIYYGLSLSDFPDLELLCATPHGKILYTSKTLRRIWKNGNVSIGAVSWQSCAYVARYNLKKLGQGSDGFAVSRNCLSEFCVMSRRPGIAGYFPIEHPEVLDNPTDKIFISDPDGVRSVNSVNFPKFFYDKLQLVNPVLYDIIKAEREDSAVESFLHELHNTDLSEFDYLVLKESEHERRSRSLLRSL